MWKAKPYRQSMDRSYVSRVMFPIYLCMSLRKSFNIFSPYLNTSHCIYSDFRITYHIMNHINPTTLRSAMKKDYPARIIPIFRVCIIPSKLDTCPDCHLSAHGTAFVFNYA